VTERAKGRRYFFQTSSNGLVTDDPDGLIFETPTSMRDAAISTLPHMALDALPDGETHEFAIYVHDDTDRPVFRATLSFRAEWLVGDRDREAD
jgi:hypothetical protein